MNASGFSSAERPLGASSKSVIRNPQSAYNSRRLIVNLVAIIPGKGYDEGHSAGREEAVKAARPAGVILTSQHSSIFPVRLRLVNGARVAYPRRTSRSTSMKGDDCNSWSGSFVSIFRARNVSLSISSIYSKAIESSKILCDKHFGHGDIGHCLSLVIIYGPCPPEPSPKALEPP